MGASSPARSNDCPRRGKFDLADPAALVLDFQARAVDLPVDYEHQVDNPEAKLKGPVPAAGWIKELAHDETGLWGRVEWTATAREMIAKKEYRYISPSFSHNKAGQIVRIRGAGLVHHPALHLNALAREEDPMQPKPGPTDKMSGSASFPERVRELIALSPEATDEEVIAALEAWAKEKTKAPDPKKFVPVEAVARMLQDRNAEVATLAETQALEKVNGAISAGRMPPALRDWAVSLCRSDGASFDAFLSKSTPAFATLSQQLITGKPPGPDRPVALTEAEQAVCAQLGLTPEQLAKA
ncbi:MAG: phage protease [Pseudorhodobacter sp.]